MAREVSNMDLKHPFSSEDLLALLSNIHQKVASSLELLPLRLALGTDRVLTMESTTGIMQYNRADHEQATKNLQLQKNLLLFVQQILSLEATSSSWESCFPFGNTLKNKGTVTCGYETHKINA